MATPHARPTPEDWARLGARIQSERGRQGLSRKQLAERARVSTGSIQAAEAGRVPVARWPQSLSAIEAALGWADGSMQRILEGGNPTVALRFGTAVIEGIDLNEPLDNTTPAAAGSPPPSEEKMFEGGEGRDLTPASYSRSLMLGMLPENIRESLPTVLEFGLHALYQGASREAARRYEDAVDGLLVSLAMPSKDEPGGRRYLSAHVRDSPLGRWRSAASEVPAVEAAEKAQQQKLQRKLLRAANIEQLDPAEAKTPQAADLIEELNEIARRIQKIAVEHLREDAPTDEE